MEHIKKVNYIDFLDRKFLSIDLNNDNLIDYEIEMINYNQNEGFLTIQKKQLNNMINLQYDITDCINLNNYLKTIALNTDFLNSLLKNIFIIIDSLPSYLLNINNVLLSKDYVFFDRNKETIKLLYVPIKEDLSNTEDCLKLLIKDIIIDYLQNTNDLNPYINELTELINNDFSLEKLKELLIKATGIHLSSSSVANTSDMPPKVNNQIPNNNVNNLPSNQEEKKSGFLNKIFKNKNKNNNKIGDKFSNTEDLKQNINLSKKEILSDDLYETTLLNSNNAVKHSKAYLLTLNKGIVNRTAISKDKFYIGRQKENVDYVIANPIIGKVHAVITQNSGNYYLTDLNSKNGTFINDKKLIPNNQYELKDDCNISFGNFHVQFKKN